MKITIVVVGVLILGCLAVPAFAGNIYGSLWIDGHPAAGAQVQIRCTAAHGAQTDGNGGYSVFVPENRRCTFHVDFGGRSGEVQVASYANPVKYDFNLVLEGDHYALQSR
jgi:hypothetical protein